ncbi:hypothetical protein [Mesorhizobium sp. Pch-S]|uniref:hypothetical protein n=1 Tax=Mesorhizobium sp. Pch-S TaxID=2082387 RepID=UPI0010117EF3|nr:hypothetical protein [Mesorhizobium sp. Pch-S]
MSYTVVIDEQERERRFTNMLNQVYRHCRVGRVTPKVSFYGGVPSRMGLQIGPTPSHSQTAADHLVNGWPVNTCIGHGW